MNQYILHTLTDYSIDEERLKVLTHTPYLFKNFYSLLRPVGSVTEGGFMCIKTKNYYDWNWGLYGACGGGHLNLVRLMIEKGANGWNFGLANACYGGHLDLVNLMIAKGANDWNWGLHDACRGGLLDLVNLMIKKGANHWNYGLHGACYGHHVDLVKLMIEKGANHCYNCKKSLEEHLQRSS